MKLVFNNGIARNASISKYDTIHGEGFEAKVYQLVETIDKESHFEVDAFSGIRFYVDFNGKNFIAKSENNSNFGFKDIKEFLNAEEYYEFLFEVLGSTLFSYNDLKYQTMRFLQEKAGLDVIRILDNYKQFGYLGCSVLVDIDDQIVSETTIDCYDIIEFSCGLVQVYDNYYEEANYGKTFATLEEAKQSLI